CEDIAPDVIIPVPISSGRLKKRGYNQSALMARQLSKRWGVPIDESMLVRRKETTLLRSLNPAERRLALSDAFAVSRKGQSGKKAEDRRIVGKTVLLIDDIYTTGATVDTCSSVLMDAGADKVYVLTLMSGGNRRPKEE
ncbi:MAG: ComF family protein, partial [Firmicutes bacterium]|nr:ComF family protein [Bacillota bacterium]